jgi:hypothetical protein
MTHFKLSRELELERILTMREAEEVSRISEDSWKRNHSDKIVRMGPRRIGVRLKDALMLTGSQT